MAYLLYLAPPARLVQKKKFLSTGRQLFLPAAKRKEERFV